VNTHAAIPKAVKPERRGDFTLTPWVLLIAGLAIPQAAGAVSQ
jgi:hypothetical protein